MSKSKYDDKTDSLVWTASTLLSALLNLTEYYLQTRPKQSLPSIFSAMHNNHYRGIGVNLFNNVLYHAVLLSLKHYVEKALNTIHPNSAVNEEIAGFVGGGAALVGSYPLSVLQAWRCEGSSWSAILKMKPSKYQLFKGFGANCLGDSLFYGSYFGIHPLLSNYDLPQSSNDISSSLFAGLLCNPFYVISNCQKTTNLKMIQQTKTLYREGGLKRFYAGFSTVSLLNLGLFGLIAGAGDRLVKGWFNDVITEPRASASGQRG